MIRQLMADFEVISVDVNDNIRNEIQAALQADLKITTAYIIDGVTDGMNDEAAFDEEVAFDIDDKTNDLNFFA